MKIIKPSFEIQTPQYTGVGALRFIERVARTCYKSEDIIRGDSAERIVKKLISSGHEAMLEHITVSARIICDRGVSHELVRHRIASFAQESTRYCNYSREKFGYELTFIKPCFWHDDSIEYSLWRDTCQMLEDTYMEMIKKGVNPQAARSILPNSIKTEIVITTNIREWRHLFKLRTSRHAHPQVREVMIPMLAEFKRLFPVMFQDVMSS